MHTPEQMKLDASVIAEGAEVLQMVADSGVVLPPNWRWPLLDELSGIAEQMKDAATLKAAQGGVTEAEDGASVLQRLGDDAAKWAGEFRATALRLGYSDMDQGWLIGWFANAIEHSGDVRRWRKEAALSAQQGQGEDDFKNFHRLLCDRFGYAHDPVDWKRDQLSLIEHIAAAPPAQPAERVPDIHVSAQGIRFGANCWYSHEYITGFEAARLNEGKCNLPARQYMKWLQDHIAASPAPSPARGDGGEG